MWSLQRPRISKIEQETGRKRAYGIGTEEGSSSEEVDLAFRFLASAIKSSRRFKFSTTLRSERMVSNSFYLSSSA
jgi:hypothetical protein